MYRTNKILKQWKELAGIYEQNCKEWGVLAAQLAEISKFSLTEAGKWRSIAMNEQDDIKPPTIN